MVYAWAGSLNHHPICLLIGETRDGDPAAVLLPLLGRTGLARRMGGCRTGRGEQATASRLGALPERMDLRCVVEASVSPCCFRLSKGPEPLHQAEGEVGQLLGCSIPTQRLNVRCDARVSIKGLPGLEDTHFVPAEDNVGLLLPFISHAWRCGPQTLVICLVKCRVNIVVQILAWIAVKVTIRAARR